MTGSATTTPFSIVPPFAIGDAEHTVVMRAAADAALVDPRIEARAGAARVDAPRPSLVVARRREPLDVAAVARRTADELTRAAPGVADIQTSPLVFDDGAAGFVVAASFDVAPSLRAWQAHALRKDGAFVTTATYTAPAASVAADEAMAAVMRSLATLTIA